MHHSESDYLDDEFEEMLDDMAPDEDEEFSDGIPDHLKDRLDQAAEENDFGATGDHPDGKLADHDEGEIRFGVTKADGKVIINFGKSTRSLGMSPEQAKSLAGMLLNHARGKA